MEFSDFGLPEEYCQDKKFVDEWSKMLQGEKYDAAYKPFLELLMRTRHMIRDYNNLTPDDTVRMTSILKSLFRKIGNRITINQPFRCDYGCNISVGENFMANFNLTILDEGRVTIGDNVLIGPNVSIYTACHPLEPKERNEWIEWAEPVTIGNNVWIGGSVTILPGVTIGDNVTIGAGSVVSRNIPPCSLAVGNPAKVIRKLNVADCSAK